MKNKQGLVAVAYAPSRVETTIDGTKVSVDLKTDYPFRDRLEFAVQVERPVQFSLSLRIPGWANSARVTVADEKPAAATPGTFHEIDRKWEGTTHVVLQFPMPPRIERRFNDAVTISRGPLMLSLAVGAEWKKLQGEPPRVVYEVLPTTPWNYALQIDPQHPEPSIRFEELPIAESPFSSAKPPVRALVQGRLLPDWKLDRDAAAPPPKSPVTSDQPLTELKLIPYGAAKLRITEFPVLAR
jgi:hypothetical protein